MPKKTHKKHNKEYGQELILDLYGCDITTISSKSAIKRFVKELCNDVIHMKRFGKPLVPHFGHKNPVTSGQLPRSAYRNKFRHCTFFGV